MSQFDEAWIKKVVSLAETSEASAKKEWTAESIFARLDAAIIGNTGYKQSLALTLSEFLGPKQLRNHLLVFGPSGTGKTYLIEQTLPDFGIPYHVIDASALTPAGYRGNNLGESLAQFFSSQPAASSGAVIVLDEFDKICEKANGGDAHKSQSLQSELLALIQGKQEGAIDTRKSLWVLLGAFAYTDEMKASPPSIRKDDLLKYGFKNELLGRIFQTAMTEVPTVDQVVRRVAGDSAVKAFGEDLAAMGWKVDWDEEAFLRLARAAQNPTYGMRAVRTIVGELKKGVVFGNVPKGELKVTVDMVTKAIG